MLPLQETSDIHNTIKLHSGMDLQNQRKSYGTVIYIYIYIYIYKRMYQLCVSKGS